MENKYIHGTNIPKPIDETNLDELRNYLKTVAVMVQPENIKNYLTQEDKTAKPLIQEPIEELIASESEPSKKDNTLLKVISFGESNLGINSQIQTTEFIQGMRKYFGNYKKQDAIPFFDSILTSSTETQESYKR